MLKFLDLFEHISYIFLQNVGAEYISNLCHNFAPHLEGCITIGIFEMPIVMQYAF